MKSTKPRLALFSNEKAGLPITRKDGSVVEFGGEVMRHPRFSGKITLPENMKAGDYEVGLYESLSKNGKPYFSGTIKPAYKREGNVAQSNHYGAKSDGYQSREDDEIPF